MCVSEADRGRRGVMVAAVAAACVQTFERDRKHAREVYPQLCLSCLLTRGGSGLQAHT